MRISDWSSDVCSSDLIVAGQAELGRDEIRYLRRDQLARSEHPARVAQDAQLQREAKTIVGAPALADMPEILIAEGIVPQQLTLIDRQVKQRPARSEAGRGGKAVVSTCRTQGSPYH